MPADHQRRRCLTSGPDHNLLWVSANRTSRTFSHRGHMLQPTLRHRYGKAQMLSWARLAQTLDRQPPSTLTHIPERHQIFSFTHATRPIFLKISGKITSQTSSSLRTL